MRHLQKNKVIKSADAKKKLTADAGVFDERDIMNTHNGPLCKVARRGPAAARVNDKF